jgi:hypothetical protein
MYSRLPPIPVPFSSHFPHHTDVTPFLCSGLMVVGHRLDCYSLLSVVFAVFFFGHPPVTVPSRRTSPNLFPPSRCACLQSASRCHARQGITLRRQFAISFSHRSECFFIALIAFLFRRFVCLVPPNGGHGHVYQKALRAEVEEDILVLISCILTHLHYPTLPHSVYYPPPPRRPAQQLLSTRLRIAYLYRRL